MKKITRKNLEGFLKANATNDSVLDLGAGKVATNHSYTEYFPNRHTVDIDPARQPDTVADIHELPFDDESYGTVLCTEVLEHCRDPKVAIGEMKRVLKTDGRLILTTRFVYPLHDVPNDYWRFTKYGLEELFKDWRIEKLAAETETFSALGALLQRVGFQTKLRGGKLTKALIYGLAYILDRLNFLLKKEYGDIRKTSKEENIMTTGYYLVVSKR